MGFYRNWFLASRPWSLSMTFISISTGFALAAWNFNFSWKLYLLTLIAGILVHTASNLLNDYYDVKSGVDNSDALTTKYRPHPLLEGKISLNNVLTATIILYSISFLIGLYLVISSGPLLLGIILIGFLLAILYTAPPLKYKYKGLGDLGVFLIWGPLMISGSYFIQTHTIDCLPIIVSFPLGLQVATVVLINSIRDISSDKKQNIITLPIKLGEKKALHLFTMMVLASYLGVIIITILGVLPLWSLLVLGSLPMAIKFIGKIYKKIPATADSEAARINTIFGLLLLISIIMGVKFG